MVFRDVSDHVVPLTSAQTVLHRGCSENQCVCSGFHVFPLTSARKMLHGGRSESQLVFQTSNLKRNVFDHLFSVASVRIMLYWSVLKHDVCTPS